MNTYNNKKQGYAGFETDSRILGAIEGITDSDLLDAHGEPNRLGHAYQMWRHERNIDKVIEHLDRRYPDWRDTAPLKWGNKKL